jgi:prevent-host-death family protein
MEDVQQVVINVQLDQNASSSQSMPVDGSVKSTQRRTISVLFNLTIQSYMSTFALETRQMQEWQATKARGAFAEIIEAAVAGTPQLIRRRDGKEVVVVSRDYFEANKPNLRDYLLTSGYAEEHDAFDDALRIVREGGRVMFAPRPVKFEE